MFVTQKEQQKYIQHVSEVKKAKLHGLLEQIEMFTKKIAIEKTKSNQLDKKIIILEQNIQMKRQQQFEKQRSNEDPDFLNRKHRIIQLKLQTLKQKQNLFEAENRQLREQINNIRRERNLFNQINRKIQLQLDNKKDDLFRVLSESNNAKQFIDEAQMELLQQQQQGLHEQLKQDKEFDDKLEKEKQNQKLIMQKQLFELSNPFLIQEQKYIKKLEGNDELIDKSSNLMFISKQSQQKNKERRNQIKEEDHLIKQLQNQLKEIEQIFERLKIKTGSQNMEQIQQVFTELEQENIILFQNLNQLDQQFDFLQQKKKQLQEQLIYETDYPEKNILNGQDYSIRVQQALQQINEAKLKKQKIQQIYNQQLEIWNVLLAGIPDILKKLNVIYIQLGTDLQKDIDINIDLNFEEFSMNNIKTALDQMEMMTQLITEFHSQQKQESSIKMKTYEINYAQESAQSQKKIITENGEEINKTCKYIYMNIIEVNKLEDEYQNYRDNNTKNDFRNIKIQNPDSFKNMFIQYEDFKQQALALKEFKTNRSKLQKIKTGTQK